MAILSASRSLCLGSAFLAVGACGRHDGSTSADRTPPPRAEFLLATQDSTFWVSTEGAKIRTRGAPLTLARYDGRFFEVYLADDDRSYQDALLVGLRVYRRDLEKGDSTIVFEDSIVPRIAREYGSAHPGAHRLAPDEEGDEDPPTQAMADLQVVDVHGPYLSYEYHVDVTKRGDREWHATRRGVLDLRTGRPAQVADLFPAAVASALIDTGKQLKSAIDSLRGDSRESARLAVSALSRAKFDERSFVLTVPDTQLAVEFDVPQRGSDVPDEVIPLAAIRPTQPSWWAELAHNFAQPQADLDRWHHQIDTSYEVIARYDSAAETARVALAAHGHEWSLRTVAAPILQLFWLDRPPLDSAQRKALGRAFNDASLYDESTRTVRDRRAHRAEQLRFATLGAASRYSSRPRA
jgi:hypothetical protein